MPGMPLVASIYLYLGSQIPPLFPEHEFQATPLAARHGSGGDVDGATSASSYRPLMTPDVQDVTFLTLPRPGPSLGSIASACWG
jgi:hypothetical protein